MTGRFLDDQPPLRVANFELTEDCLEACPKSLAHTFPYPPERTNYSADFTVPKGEGSNREEIHKLFLQNHHTSTYNHGMNLHVRDMDSSEIPLMVNYFHSAEPKFLHGMGVYTPDLPEPVQWQQTLEADFAKPMPERAFLYTVWEQDSQLIGHCNVNKLVYGDHGYMHLHMWTRPKRRQGLGAELVRRSVEIFFDHLQLKRLFCEPYSLNPAPNKTLPKAGFRYLYTHETKPGPFNFHQLVTRWVIER